MFEIKSEEKVTFMSSLVEASQLIEAIAGRSSSKGELRRKAWRKVAKHFTWNRISDLHRREPRARPSGDEIKILRAAARQQEEAEREGRREYREVMDWLARLEARLDAIDPDFHRSEVAALREGFGMARDIDRAVDEG